MTDTVEWVTAGVLTLGCLGSAIAWLHSRFEDKVAELRNEMQNGHKLNKEAIHDHLEEDEKVHARIEKIVADLLDYDRKTHAELYSKVDTIRDEFVRRDDFRLHNESVLEHMKQLREEVRDDMKALTARLDAIVTAVTRSAPANG